MASAIEMSASQRALSTIVRRIHNRWRLKLVLRGLVIILGAAVLGIAIGPWLMARFHFAPASVIAVRLVFYGALAVLAVRHLVLPLRRRVSEGQVALYLEEHEPTLDAVMVTAVDAAGREAPETVRSSRFVARLMDSAVTRAQAIGAGTRIDQSRLTTSGAAVLGILAVGVFLIAAGPGRQAGMLNPFADPSNSPYSIAVSPGNAQVTRGGDQTIIARMRGFTASEVTIAVRRSEDGGWERFPMTVARDSGAFELRLFDIRSRTSYYVEAKGLRSPVFHLEVVDLPYVKTLALALQYPAYTGQPTEMVDRPKDLLVLEGTTIDVRATTTKPVKGGRIVLEGNRTVPMTLDDKGNLSAAFTVSNNGSYRIELETLSGHMVPGSLEYNIEMVKDRAPAVVFRKPGRDVRITPVEEVSAEVEANDDYGLTSVELRYSVNGAPEKVIPLLKGKPRQEVLAPYHFSTEEFGAKPGDLVSYYAIVKDNDAFRRGKSTKSDIYFLDVRNFENRYKLQKSGGGGGGGGQQDSDAGEYSKRQRQITSATFKLDRDRTTVAADEFKTNLNTIVLLEEQLHGQLEKYLKNVNQRGGQLPADVKATLKDAVAAAVTEIKAAEELLKKQDPHGATVPQQRALYQLQRADAAFRELAKQEPGKGGGGGGGAEPPKKFAPAPEDMADLFGLRRDEARRNQSVSGGARSASAGQRQKVDKLAEMLRQLSAKLQQQNERMQGMRPSGKAGKGPTGSPPKPSPAAQAQQQQVGQALRDLAQQAEMVASQLDEVARQRPDDRNIPESAKQLRQIASDLKKAAAQGDNAPELVAAATRRLAEARRLLEESQKGSESQDANDAMELARAIATGERDIQQQLSRLPAPGTPDRAASERDVTSRKDELAGDINALESIVKKIAQDVQKSSPEAARKFNGVADTIRATTLQDLVATSKTVLSTANASNFERQIARVTDRLPHQVADAIEALKRRDQAASTHQLASKAHDLVNRAAALADRQSAEKSPKAGQQQNQQQGQQQDQGKQPGKDGKDKKPGQGQGQGQTPASQGQGQGKSSLPSEGQGSSPSPGAGQGPGDESSAATSGTGSGGRAKSSPRLQANELAASYKELEKQAEEMKKDMQRRGLDTKDLARAMEEIKSLGRAEGTALSGAQSGLAESVVASLKAVEFTVLRQLQKEDLWPTLGGSSDVPTGYKPLVAEYYQSVAEQSK